MSIQQLTTIASVYVLIPTLGTSKHTSILPQIFRFIQYNMIVLISLQSLYFVSKSDIH